MNKVISSVFVAFTVILLSLSLIPAQISADIPSANDVSSIDASDENSAGSVEVEGSRFERVEENPVESDQAVVIERGSSSRSKKLSNSQSQEETSLDIKPEQFGDKLDINMDCKVDRLDFVHIKANFNRSLGIYQNGDVNGDGIINVLDFNILAGSFNTVLDDCTPQDPFGNGNPLIDQKVNIPADSNGDNLIDRADFEILEGYFGEYVVPGYNGDLDCSGFVDASDFNILAGSYGMNATEVISCNRGSDIPQNPSSGGGKSSDYVNDLVPLSAENSKFLDFTGSVTQYAGDQIVKVVYFVNGLKVESESQLLESSDSIELL